MQDDLSGGTQEPQFGRLLCKHRSVYRDALPLSRMPFDLPELTTGLTLMHARPAPANDWRSLFAPGAQPSQPAAAVQAEAEGSNTLRLSVR